MSSYSYSSSSFSSSTTTRDGRTTGYAQSTEQHSDPRGTTVRYTSQDAGGPTIQETRYYDQTGRELPADVAGRRIEPSSSSAGYGGAQNRVEDVTDRDDGYKPPQAGETEADRAYRESMEDEYAKREGGA